MLTDPRKWWAGFFILPLLIFYAIKEAPDVWKSYKA